MSRSVAIKRHVSCIRPCLQNLIPFCPVVQLRPRRITKSTALTSCFRSIEEINLAAQFQKNRPTSLLSFKTPGAVHFACPSASRGFDVRDNIGGRREAGEDAAMEMNGRNKRNAQKDFNFSRIAPPGSISRDTVDRSGAEGLRRFIELPRSIAIYEIRRLGGLDV